MHDQMSRASANIPDILTTILCHQSVQPIDLCVQQLGRAKFQASERFQLVLHLRATSPLRPAFLEPSWAKDPDAMATTYEHFFRVSPCGENVGHISPQIARELETNKTTKAFYARSLLC